MKEYSLSEFNNLVKDVLKVHLEPSYWIVAEIGEMNQHSSGHCYLTLVEKSGNKELAKLRANIWSFTFNNLHRNFINATGSPLQPGMKILLNGVLDFHPIYGVSLTVRDIDPNYTLGERERTKQETIKRLQEEELIDLNKQFALPIVLDRIAIISSESAAGYGDFIDQLARNEYGYAVKYQLYPATMQGDQAAESILVQLDIINEKHMDYDAVVVIRGGGSKTDLDCFDDYELCAGLAQASLPIITGIGHERDQTIADLVANVNLKTPTAVAEFVLSSMLQFESEIMVVMDRMARNAQQQLENQKLQIADHQQKIKLLTERLVLEQTMKIDLLDDTIKKSTNQRIESENKQLKMFERLLLSYDPELILQRGFTLTQVNGRSIQLVNNIKPGDEMETKYHGGTVKSKVE